MDRINDVTASATEPALPSFAGAIKGYFITGTRIRVWWLNLVQESLMAIITAAGFTGDATNPGLLLTSLLKIFALGRLISTQSFSAVGTAVYTPTAGTKSVLVLVMGGGGAGGGAVVNSAGYASAGIPGNGAAFGVGFFTSAFAGVTVTVAAGGVPVNGGNGGNGGSSSFGALLSSPGGPGGNAGPSQSGSASGGNGNTSGLPSGANLFGAVGGLATVSFGFTTGQVAIGGSGGSSAFGAGGTGVSVNYNGANAPSYGAGGGGVLGNGNSAALYGGAGKQGIVIVLELG